MKATLEMQRLAWEALFETPVMHELRKTGMHLSFSGMWGLMPDLKRERTVRFNCSAQTKDLDELEIRAIKAACGSFTFEKSRWEEAQKAQGIAVYRDIWSPNTDASASFDHLTIYFTLDSYMLCTPDEPVVTEDGQSMATADQLQKLEEKFLNGDIKLENCALDDTKTERCMTVRCGASADRDGYCYQCLAGAQEELETRTATSKI